MDKPKGEQEGSFALSRRNFFNTVAVGATEVALLSAPETAGAQEIVDANLIKTTLTVNGETHTFMVEPRWTLLHVLRDRLGLTGTKPGCERGECGACTVLIDGVSQYSCLTLALEADRKSTRLNS